MKTVGERIKQAREYRQMSGEELALAVGYKTQSGISNLENRATGRGGFMLPKIAEHLNFAVDWFLEGPDTDDMAQVPPYKQPFYETQPNHHKGALYVAENATPYYPTRPTAPPPPGALQTNGHTQRKVWVVGKGQGGMPERLWTDGDYPVGITDEYSDVSTSDPHAFLARVEGNSMYPKFESGNYVLVEPGTEPELEECVLVRLSTGETLIKKLLSRRNGYRLGSFSSPEVLEYAPEQVSWMYYIAHEVPRRKIKSRH